MTVQWTLVSNRYRLKRMIVPSSAIKLAWWQNMKSALEIGLAVTLCYHVETIFLLSIRVSGLKKRGFPKPV